MRPSVVLGVVAACLALTACGSDEQSFGGIKVDFDTSDAAPEWSPDGELIAFASNRDGGGIFVVGTDGRGIRRLTATRGDNPDWSPDGKELVFETGDGLRLISRDGKNERVLTRVQRTDKDLWPEWSPDGRRIAFVHGSPAGAFVVYVVPRGGGKARRLLESALAPDHPDFSALTASELTPSWSPDGKRIAYDRGDGQLVVVTIASGKRVPLDTAGAGAAFEPAWSPDGKQLAAQCDGTLCVVDLATGDLRTLLGDAGAPSWSPDGKQIVVERYLYGSGRAEADPQALYVVDAVDGEEREPLTFGPGEED